MEDRNVLIKIRGEADMTDAQLQLQEMTDKGKRLQRELADLSAAEKNFIQQQQSLTDSGKAQSQRLNQLIDEHKRLKREVQEEINANQRNISALKQSISSYNAQQGAVSRTAQQIRAMREELAKMEMAGDTSSQQFINLSVQAAKLTDQMGDTQNQIRILASDTANLDAAMSVGSGLAGVFTTATSAAALLGGENEALEKSFLQVQAAMAVLNGVQQVANTLNKDSAANVVIRTALQKLFNKEKAKESVVTVTSTTTTTADTGAKIAQTAATTAATAATNKLTAAMLKNPAGLILVAIAALVAGIVYLTEKTKEAAVEQRNLNGLLEDYDALAKRRAADQDYYIRLAEAEGKSEREILQMRRENNDKEIAEAEKLYSEMQTRRKTAHGKLEEDEQKAFDEALARQQKAYEERRTLNNEYDYLEARERKDAADKAAAEEKKRADEAAAAAKKRNDEILAAEKELAATRLRLMKDSKGKELMQIEAEYKDKIEAVKGNSKAEIALREALAQEMSRKQAEASKKWDGKRAEEAHALTLKIIETELSQTEDGTAEYEALLKRKYEADVEYTTKTIENQKELDAELGRLAADLENNLNNNDKKIAESRIKNARKASDRRISEEENADLRILLSTESTNEQRKAAAEDLAAHEAKLWAVREDELNAQRAAGLISEADYQQAMLDLERERLNQSKQQLEEHAAMVQEITQGVLSFVGDMASTIFGAVSDALSQQIEDLDNMYTTDAEKAKESADKKYITEKELERKKLAIRQKQARIEKAEAVFSIGISTAQAIMTTLAQLGATPWGIAASVMAGALGAAQLAIALAKPLPQYAKGRKGGRGEYAIVGERGAEMMYIPDGASIVPHDKMYDPEAWGAYGVPALPDFTAISMAGTFGSSIDYDRLGKAVADNLPKQTAVSVNVDRNGVLVTEMAGSTRYLNQKYTGRWI